MSDPKSNTIETLLNESRHFPPSSEFSAQANINSQEVVDEAHTDWQGWWATWAEKLTWDKKWDSVLQWEEPFAKWFDGGKLNASVQCLDRHVTAGLGNRVAYHWEGEPGDTRELTYQDMLDGVCKTANGLKELGIVKGDR